MRFLEPPSSPSTSNFIIEEDSRSEGSDLPPNNKYKTPCARHPHRSTYTILTFIILLLATLAATFSFLYFYSFPSFEVCKTRQCTRTATLFLRTMDETVDPCEDFHKFACGNWISDTAAVVSVAVYDHTTIMRDRIVGRLRGLTENITNSDIPALQQIKIMYSSCVDLATIESVGISPLKELLQRLVQPQNSIAKTLALIHRETGQDFLFDNTIGPSFKDTRVYGISIDHPQQPLGKETFLYARDTVAAYSKLISQVFSRVLPDSKPNHVATFEEIFARAASDEENRNKASMSNLLSIKELNMIFSRQDQLGDKNQSNNTFDWLEYTTTLFANMTWTPPTEDFLLNINDLAYIHKLANILRKSNPSDIREYIRWQLLYAFGKDVTKELRDLFNTFSTVSQGNDASPNRHTECLILLDDSLPFAITHKYVLKYVKPEIINEATHLFRNIVHAFKNYLKGLPWMDYQTKQKALQKANRVKGYIGYPSWLLNSSAVEAYHEGLHFQSDAFFLNLLAMVKWIAMREIINFNSPVDDGWTEDSPAEADAFYDDERNAVTFPSGFLQEPFIGMGLKAIDYGALGSVVGHELTHGFDTTGRFSDSEGRLNSWWSLDTLKLFIQKTECLVNQYSAYWLPELANSQGVNNTVNGLRTLAENIADNGGIREAFQAYQYFVQSERKGVPEPRLPGLEKYDTNMVFFLSFAQSWCSYLSPPALSEMVLSNVHSPPKFRIIGPLSNFAQFSSTFKCSEHAKMNPPKKCVLWG